MGGETRPTALWQLPMKPRTYQLFGFEGRGGHYLVLETSSATEARDLRDARVCSGFPTVVFSAGSELAAEELDRLAGIEERFR
jgi:hypothetical protein